MNSGMLPKIRTNERPAETGRVPFWFINSVSFRLVRQEDSSILRSAWFHGRTVGEFLCPEGFRLKEETMSDERKIEILAVWDDEAKERVASSAGVPGLITVAETTDV